MTKLLFFSSSLLLVASSAAASVVPSSSSLRGSRTLQQKLPTCNDVQLLRQYGETKYPEGAAQILSVDATSEPRTVEVGLQNLWVSSNQQPVDSIFSYFQENAFDKKCYESTSVFPSTNQDDYFERVQITCSFLQPRALLEICVADNNDVLSLTGGDNAVVPKCCYPTFPPDTPVVCYTLDISCEPCEEAPPSPTESPTASPVEETVTAPPIPAPTTETTRSPTEAPVEVPPPEESCKCGAGDEHAGSFKCGKDVYLCPGISAICEAQSNSDPTYWFMNDEECEEMKRVDLGQKCIALPDQGLTHPKALSNRVCYGGDYEEFGYKVDGDGCDTCKDGFFPPTKSPTASPVEEAVTEPPVPASTTDEPTAAPVKTEDPTTDYPTYDSDDSDDDTDEPTAAPVKTNEPTAAPVQTDEPTSAPVESPTGKTSCECDVNDEEALTFKCGKDMYICPGVDHICAVSPAQGSKFYDITQEQCDEMKTVGLSEKCVPLPQYGITDSGPNGAKGLSHRDCYNDFAPNGMKEDGSCDICKNSFAYEPGKFSLMENFSLLQQSPTTTKDAYGGDN